MQPQHKALVFKLVGDSEVVAPQGRHVATKGGVRYLGALSVGISMDLLMGLCSYWGVKLRKSGFTQIFSTPKEQKYVEPGMFQRSKNVLKVLYCHAKLDGAWTSPATRSLKTFFLRAALLKRGDLLHRRD